MKTTIDKEFFERWKDKDVVMWCKKKEYAEEFCRLMHEQGLKWSSDESYLSENNWDSYTAETTYNFNKGLCTGKDWYDSKGYTILDFEDYIVEEKITNTTNNLPNHYNISEVDTMDLILTICEHNNTDVRESFYLANTLKYLIRYKNKNGIEDLNKAKDYLDRLINEISKQGE